MQLSKSQKQAVEYTDGPQIILAGAGSGKTRVIVGKAQYLIEQKSIAPESLLIITYSNKTQAELEERMSELGDTPPEIRTFHSFGMDVITEFGGSLKLPGDIVKAGQYRLRNYLKSAIAELKNSILLDTNQPDKVYSDIDKFISRAKDELFPPDLIIQKAEESLAKLPENSSEDHILLQRDNWTKTLEAAKIYKSYERVKTERMNLPGGGIDYGDMIVLCHKLLKENKIVGAKLRSRYKYVLVDEFQDTNFAQVEMLYHLWGGKVGITVVGDDDQAIYRFRGASFGSFKLFETLFDKPKLFRLEENYRSSANIVKGAQALIEVEPEARFDPDKKMLPASDLDGDRIRVRFCENETTEAESVACEIEELLKNDKYNEPCSIAVLFRVRRHKDQLVEALNRKNISFHYDQKITDSQSKPAKLLNDIYEFIVDDRRRDLLMSIIRNYVPGLNQSLENEIGYKLGRDSGDSLKLLSGFAELDDDETSQKLKSLVKFLSNFRESKSKLDPIRLLEHIAVESGMLNSLIVDGEITDHDTLSEISGLLRASSEFHQETGSTSHVDFLEFLSWWKKNSDNNSSNGDQEISSPVILQTVHGSKGLEYPVVFVIGLSNRKFPAPNRSSTVDFPIELFQEALPKGDFRKQEERRLFYVAMTRAREKLYLYGIQRKGVKISQYVQELMKSNLFDLFGESEEIKIDLMINVPEYGPEVSKEPPGYFIIPMSDDDNIISVTLNKLWKSLSAQAKNEEEFDNLKIKFLDASSNSISKIGDSIKSDKFTEPAEEQQINIKSLAYSDLESFETCPLQFYYRKILRMPSPVGSQLTFGNIIHTILEDAGKKMIVGEKVSSDNLHSELDKQWRGASFDDPDRKERMIDRAREQLDNFVIMQSGLTGKTVDVERKFTIDLGTVKLLGKIDRIDKADYGYEIIDYKTGKRDEKKLKDDLQLPIYSLACKSIYGEYPKRAMYMFLKYTEPFIVKIDDDKIENTISIVKSKAEKIQSSDFTATPGYHCNFCGYARICPARQK